MKHNMMNFAVKSLSLALFLTIFLFNADLGAADGCHVQNGCDTSASALFNTAPFSTPTYAPSWTDVTATLGRARGGQYMKFAVTEGEIYVWSTEGSEDVFYGNYAQECTEDANCRTASDTSDKGLRCLGGYCLLPFDTELTLLKGETCSAEAEFLAYSNSDGFRNQSQLEWKATFTGNVVLLITNYEYQTGSDGEFKPCQKTTDMTTTVKWHRTASEHCETCDNPVDYRQDKTSVAAVKAPSWTTLQSREAVNLTDFYDSGANASWARPGSYLVFNVTKNRIYRWSTCVSELQDTQLSLFKGEANHDYDPETDSDSDSYSFSCGEFLAYGDDSEVSYSYNGQTFCPAGTKQTVLEWQANFTGKVTLLLNEYNCYQCNPFDVPAIGKSWLNCFVEVTGEYKTDGSGNFVMENGWPVEAASGDSSVVATFVYPFPLDWQRYDCDTCSGTQKAKIADYTTESSGWESFCTTSGGTTVCSGSENLSAGQYVTFSLKRGSKYLFKAADPTAIISIRKGANCTGDTVAQATGQLAYFANTDDFDNDDKVYNPDVISVFVSKADCNTGDNVLTYSYYTAVSGANVDTRFTVTTVTGSNNIITDNTTTLQFVDTGSWASTWKDAIKKCQEFTVGTSGSSDILPCPPTQCPAGNYTDSGDTYFCTYNSTGADSNGKCRVPVCNGDYSEYEKNSSNDENFWGKCYYSGDSCDTQTSTYTWQGEDKCVPAAGGCASGYELNHGMCCPLKCKDNQYCVTKGGACSDIGADYVCPEGYTEDGDVCYNESSGFDIYVDPEDIVDATIKEYSPDPDVQGATYECPSGTTLADGVCKIDNCGTYTKDNIKAGTKAQCGEHNEGSGAGYRKYDCLEDKSKCYLTADGTEEVPCCCDSPIYDVGKDKTLNTPVYYVTETAWGGTVISATEALSCGTPDTSCADGFEYKENTDKCYKCEDGDELYPFGDSNWLCIGSCDVWTGDGGTPEKRRCVTCEDGSTPVNDGGTWKCMTCTSGTLTETDDGWKCKHECTGYEKDGRCYTSAAEEAKCKEGWVTDPADPGKCRKLQVDPDGYVSVECAHGDLKANEPGRTCDADNPNSYDCDCYYDRCEDGRQAADAKVCPNPYKGYLVTTETTTVTLNGEAVPVASICRYTDASGQTCGEAMGGWTLPNINQLYSIVDFDLYDPATAYPFSGNNYNRTDISANSSCAPVESQNTSCTNNSDCNSDNYCAAGKCIASDPFGDLQCSGEGRYLCIDNKCVRNNWYWSSTTVVSEKDDNGQFTWAVNLEDGRSYRAVKGCSGDDCAETVDLSARPHHVLCIKGSTIAGIFDADAPSAAQTFSGWACDKNDEATTLTIYFEITDSDNNKDVVALLDESDHIMTIPGLLHKGIKYGASDITPTSTLYPEKMTEIYNNCGFPTNPAAHAFEIKWNGEVTAGKEEVAAVIMSLKDKECSEELLTNGGDTSSCAVPPYFVTAYGVNESSASASAVKISPENRPFVFTNRCGDGYKTYDGTYQETCESESFATICAYGNADCELCAQEELTVSGETVKACTLYNATPPSCMDGTIQSYYCNENGVIEDGHTGAGLACEYYNFASSNIISSSEECDCDGGSFYYYTSDEFNCSRPLDAKVCPDYYTTESAANNEDNFCYICAGCKKEKVWRPRCGDSIVQRSNCDGYDNCQVVDGADEQCDDGNNSNTDSCTNSCKLPVCGDGYIQGELGEICDSGEKNGYYSTNCVGTTSCPGCASMTCGKDDTDALGPRCGDEVVQHIDLCSDGTFLTTYGPVYGFSSEADCRTKMAGAAEVCDKGGDANGLPVAFDAFLATSEGADCAEQIGDRWYPLNAIHAKYAECVYKYKQFIANNPGCSADCTKSEAPYCGDGHVDAGEICDEGLPTVTLVDGKYQLAAGDSYNGVGYGHCMLDCKGKYECSNSMKETTACTGMSTDNFCPNVGSAGLLYVKNAAEVCDEGILNGSYGHCAEDCLEYAYCGNGNKVAATDLGDCIEKTGDTCTKYEECDFGESGQNPNTTVDKAYSKNPYGSCISEDENCRKGTAEWGDRICCEYGRFCGDGTVDNGAGVGDAVDWKTMTNWSVEGANAAYDARNLSLRFELTGSVAVAMLNIDIPVDTDLRYFLEFDMMPILYGTESVDFNIGVNEYDESSALLENSSYSNASPYYFVTIEKDTPEYLSGYWYHGKNTSPVKGEAQGAAWMWYTGTKTVRILINMYGTAGTEFLVRGLKFYSLENVSYKGSGDSSEEMCDPGMDNFKTSSASYMTDCDSNCKWINYCGDSIVQRSGSDCDSEGKYNGYTCASGISGAAEICDNGTNATNTYNGCEPGCLELGPHCGDGITDQKSCTEGDASCNTPNGLDTAEKCDLGVSNSNDPLPAVWITDINDYSGYCREDCRPARCGDGILDNVKYDDGTLEGAVAEECDCGAAGAYYETTKSQTTEVNGKTVYLCVTDDDQPVYNTNLAKRSAVCRPNCTISRCGDGIKDPDEECDDGNLNDYDSCTSQCKLNTCGDGIFAYSRSYLCEELKGMNSTQLTSMAAKGVVDCGGTGEISCSDLAAALTTDSAVKDYFDMGTLHCCYNPKLEGGADDRNCEIQLDGIYFTPKALAVRRCTKYAYNVVGSVATLKTEAECEESESDHIEKCESCTTADCGCSELYAVGSTDYKNCVDNNVYCDNTCWNRIGRCGDGRIDNGESPTIDAGEKCDNNYALEERKYTDLYGLVVAGGSSGIGNYCTGPCVGSCDNESPMCGGTVTNNCWSKGCTVKVHKSGVSDTSVSHCGDKIVDIYAGEKCDEGDGGSFETNWCNSSCQWNTKDGVTARCGDGTTQAGSGEVCDDGNDDDDDYCVNSCHTYYGTCGDGKIAGPGYSYDSKWTPEGEPNGPEDCDPLDARTKSLVDLGTDVYPGGAATFCAAADDSDPCTRIGTCGDGIRNPRFEGCDFGTGNATQNITKNGVTCFAGCKSNPEGGLIKATNSEISGWACDPDHPMTHPTTLVRIEIYDVNGTEVGKKTLATTEDPSGTDYFGKSVDAKFTVKECGGGESHGWTYDPSSSDASMAWEGKVAPFTVKAYAATLDGSPETEVFLGEKTFVRSMVCGDAYRSLCSTVEVTALSEESATWAAGNICKDDEVKNGCAHYGLTNGEACEDTDSLTCSSITVVKLVKTQKFWAAGKTCNDSEVYGGCAAYGLTNGEACVDEQCDLGSSVNGDDKDCDSKCQWTSCGDGIVQANATGVRTDHTSYEECDGTKPATSITCESLSDINKEQPTDVISGNATCIKNSDTSVTADKCKWKRASICTIKSTCPALSTALAGWGSKYDTNYPGRYIKYVNGDNPTYTRTHNGTGWPEAETVVKYKDVASTAQEKACAFTCIDSFKWEGGKCVPRTDIELECSACNDASGVWFNTSDSCKTVGKKIKQTVTLNSNGTVTYVPETSPVPAAWGETTSATECIWECNGSTKHFYNSTDGHYCQANTKTFECGVTISSSDYAKPNNTSWIKVTKDSSGKVVLGSPSSSLTITQVLTNGSDPSATPVYSPTDDQLKAIDINNESLGPKNALETPTTDAVRCYYTCAAGYYYVDGSGCVASQCGDGVINSEHCDTVTDTESTCVYTLGKDEKCDDGTTNGHYGEKSTGKSHCKNDCSGRIKNGTQYFCGDGVVQYKDGESCSGVSCESVTTSNYPGATLSAFTASEQCDPSDTANNRTTLCNRALGLSRTSYYTPSTEPSCTASCSISNATKGTNCMWCGDGVWQTSQGEKCDSGKDYNNATGTTTLCNAKLGENRSSYYTPSTRPSCSTNCQTILNAVKGTNCQWCGDGVVNGTEKCDYSKGFSATCYIQNGSYECNCDHGNGCKSCAYYDYYSVSCNSSCGYQKSLSSSNNKSTSGNACSYYGL